MNTTTFPKFAACVCVGDTITWDKEGFTLVARIARDYGTSPRDFDDVYTPEDVARWENGEWFYGGVVLTVSLGGLALDTPAASLWGVDCNFGENNDYLSEVAQELEGEALEAACASVERIKTILQNH